jgi:hypothetical protein
MRWLWLLLLVPSLAQASNVAVCDPNDGRVPDRMVAYHRSVNTPDWLLPNVLINPDLSALTETNRRYWKCDQPGNARSAWQRRGGYDCSGEGGYGRSAGCRGGSGRGG